MRTRKLLAGIAAVGIGVFMAASPAPGEVSVNLDPDGRYHYTSFLVVDDGDGFAFWAAARKGPPGRLLNPDGDRFGDGRPAIAENPDDARPVVVWSRTTGRNRLLVWSTWEGDGWSLPRWVHTLPVAAADADPILTVDPDGVLHLVWVRDNGVGGRIYWSRWLGDDAWIRPRPLTPASIDVGALRLDTAEEWPGVRFGPPEGAGRVTLPRPGRTGLDPIAESEVLQDGITDDPDVLP